jgi:transcriptional regulator with XRE-family HTH domain
MTIQEAARELRAHMKESQQAMATGLGLSMGAVRNYESGAVAVPEARPLYAYMLTAETGGRPDLAAVFRSAFYDVVNRNDYSNGHLAVEPTNAFEEILVAALLAVVRKEGFEKLRVPLLETLVAPYKALARDLPVGTFNTLLFNAKVSEFTNQLPAADALRFRLVLKKQLPKDPSK